MLPDRNLRDLLSSVQCCYSARAPLGVPHCKTVIDMPQLLIHSDTGETSYLTIDKDIVTVGRRSENDLCLPHLSVSGYHARIVAANSCLVIEDQQSTNGTMVNGQRIDQQVLVHLDDITIGSYKISYSETSSISAADHSAAVENVTQLPSIMPIIDPSLADPINATPAAHPPAESSYRVDPAAIRVASGDKAGSVVKLQKPLTTVGKAGGDLGAIAKKATGYYFLPVNDRSAPMTHNGKGLTPQVEVKLVCGDIIGIGGERLEFVHPYLA